MTKLLYWDWVKEQAAAIHSDGCSGVPEFYHKCCLQHDLFYWYAKDPQEAYKRYLLDLEPWHDNLRHGTKAEADTELRQCIQNCSKLGKFSPMSWWRWVAVKYLANKAWNSHAATQAEV